MIRYMQKIWFPWQTIMWFSRRCVARVQRSFQQSFSQIMTLCGWDREFKALFYSAASLCYQVPDTLLETTPITLYWHIIRTLWRPVPSHTLKIRVPSGEQLVLLFDFGILQLGIEPGTSRSRSGHSTYCASEAGDSQERVMYTL